MFFTVACHQRVSQSGFLHLYLDSLRQRMPDVKFRIIADKTIAGEKDGKQIRHHIDNAFTQYQLMPDSLGAILHILVEASLETYKPTGALQREHIIPVIKSM